MQEGVSIQTTWGIHLTNQCWGILNWAKRKEKHEHFQGKQLQNRNKPKADGRETLMFDLVFAVVVWLQMFHVKSVVGRTDSTQVQSMTDLEADAYSC